MSNDSLTTRKHQEKLVLELTEELDSLRAMNRSLRAYLEHIHGFKQNLAALNSNYTKLTKVHTQWIDNANVFTDKDEGVSRI